MQSSGRPLSDHFWKECRARLRSDAAFSLLKGVVEHAASVFTAPRLTIQASDPKTISFQREGREILTVNVGLTRLRIYVHPAAGAYFDPDSQFEVEKFRFWDSSYHRDSGTYRAMSVWGSSPRDLPGIKSIIDRIPR